jgi:alginate O-acetyltransferase complex protein AlgI
VNVASLEWVVGFLFLSAIYWIAHGVRQRQVILAACNLAFIASWMPNPASWATLLGFVLSGYSVARFQQIYRHKSVLVIYLVTLVAAFLILKQYAFIAFLHPATLVGKHIATVGLSYIFFRQIHFVVDVYQGQIQELRLWDYANYQMSMFGFIAGPIQRFQDFTESWSRLEPVLKTSEEILRAYSRIFLGVVKITIVAGFCLSKFDKWLEVLTNPKFIGSESTVVALIKFLGVFYSYPIYVYFNFSGYCDMVIAGALLVGIKMPENFDRPYLSRNMIDFWTRWHRSLGFWIRDYLFTPMYKAIAGRSPKSANSLAFLCYFIALFVAGVWHGTTWSFVVFGLLNGCGVAASKLWENWIVARRGRQGLRHYLLSRPIKWAATFCTLNFMCGAMLFVGMDIPKAVAYFKAGLAILAPRVQSLRPAEL